jgi:hypothetical protein
MKHEHLRELLRKSVTAVCGKGAGLPINQALTNAVGLRMAWQWAQEALAPGDDPVTLYAAEHRTNDGLRLPLAKLRHRKHVMYEPYEFISDVFVTRWVNKIESPLVAAEVEAFRGHGVAYEDCRTAKGYWWDLEKLLYVKAPRKLFIARCPTKKLPMLVQTIQSKWREMDAAIKTDEWALVLLPAAPSHVDRVQIATATAGEDVEFVAAAP